ncbi:MAG: ribonuclease D [Acidobacteriota bacterium]
MTVSSLPQPADVRFEILGDSGQLRAASERWLEREVIALDTEFVRERTFFPALGLLQIASGNEVFLVDPLAIDDFGPLIEVLEAASVLKILHSGSEDLEVLGLEFDALPHPLFDTQTAAALVGRGYSPGYARLIDDLFGLTIPKGETRSNWLRRPLRPAQLHYAALDVAYLIPAYRQLAGELEQHGRTEWMVEEGRRQLENASTFPEDEDLYLKIGRARHMSRVQLAALRELVAWREREARKRDLPRNFVIREPALIALALQRPRSFSRLREVDGVDPKVAERHGRALLQVIRDAASLPANERPEHLPRVTDLSQHKHAVSRLRAAVQQVADELNLAPELLASKRTVEELKRRSLDGARPLLPGPMRGWRSEVLSPRLLPLLGES